MDAQTFARLYREHSGAIVARVIRLAGGDFSLAEESVQEAFAAALAQWPGEGTPRQPRAWLLRTARHKAIDRLRRRSRFESPLELELDALRTDDWTEPDELSLQDDGLRLIFTCCHPALEQNAQIALTLHTLCGLTTDEIARAFLIEPTALAQRLVRAKNKIKLASIPYSVPARAELPERLEAVLAVVYLVFGEGYAATSGDVLIRSEMSREAIRIGRLLEQWLPDRPEPIALTALMLLHDSRRAARIDAAGETVLLEEQDRTRWDQAAIAEGLERVERTLRLGGATAYGLQAAIAALHARATTPAETDWPQIVLLYEELLRRANTPVIQLNYAAAVAMLEGPERGLALMSQLAEHAAMRNYHLFFAARADLLRRAGRHAEAIPDYEHALTLVRNEPERRFLSKRLTELRTRK